MKKILLLTEKFYPDLGGVATSAKRIYKSLSNLGVEIDIIVWSRYLQPGEVLREENIYRIGLFRNWDMTTIHTLNLLESLTQEFDYDAIWGHYLFPSGFVAVWFSSLYGFKSIVSARGNDIDREVFPPGDFGRLRWTLENATIITAVSQNLADKIKLISSRNDVFILKNAVDTKVFSNSIIESQKQELRGELGIKPDELVLGFSGELRAKKGQNFLLNALSTVRKQYSACLLIIGEVRSTDDSIFSYYKMEHLEDYKRVIITGHLKESFQVSKYLQLCDLFLLPSIWEGFPNSLIEAMACGVCCLASDAGGIPEIISSEVNGFLLPRNQLQYLGEAVLEFLELDKDVKDKIISRARDRIIQEFSLSAERVRLQQVLNQLDSI